jgi:hypothetical protein
VCLRCNDIWAPPIYLGFCKWCPNDCSKSRIYLEVDLELP